MDWCQFLSQVEYPSDYLAIRKRDQRVVYDAEQRVNEKQLS